MDAPTIGRRVWFWPSKTDQSNGITQHKPDVPCDAGIIYVNTDESGKAHVSVNITDHNGGAHVRHGVELTTYEDRKPGGASWMPYQQKKAAEEGSDTATKAAAKTTKAK